MIRVLEHRRERMPWAVLNGFSRNLVCHVQVPLPVPVFQPLLRVRHQAARIGQLRFDLLRRL